MERFSTTIILGERSNEYIEGQQEKQSGLNLVSNYEELKEESTKSSQELYPQVKSKDQSQPRIIFAIDSKDKTFNLAMLEPNIKYAKSTKDFKASQVKIILDNINTVDKIELHKRT